MAAVLMYSLDLGLVDAFFVVFKFAALISGIPRISNSYVGHMYTSRNGHRRSLSGCCMFECLPWLRSRGFDRPWRRRANTVALARIVKLRRSAHEQC